MTPTQEPTALPKLEIDTQVYPARCYTMDSVHALLEGIEERFAPCKIRHWDDEDGEQKYYDLYDDSMLDKLLEQIREARR